MLLTEIALSSIGALSTYSLIHRWKICPVKASAGATLLLGFLSFLFFNNYMALFPIIFGASFIGMSCQSRFSFLEVAVASIIFVILIAKLPEYLPQIGGVLGFTAFCSISIIYAMKFIAKKFT